MAKWTRQFAIEGLAVLIGLAFSIVAISHIQPSKLRKPFVLYIHYKPDKPGGDAPLPSVNMKYLGENELKFEIVFYPGNRSGHFEAVTFNEKPAQAVYTHSECLRSEGDACKAYKTEDRSAELAERDGIYVWHACDDCRLSFTMPDFFLNDNGTLRRNIAFRTTNQIFQGSIEKPIEYHTLPTTIEVDLPTGVDLVSPNATSVDDTVSLIEAQEKIFALKIDDASARQSANSQYLLWPTILGLGFGLMVEAIFSILRGIAESHKH